MRARQKEATMRRWLVSIKKYVRRNLLALIIAFGLMAIGWALNFVVIMSNGGKMPVVIIGDAMEAFIQAESIDKNGDQWHFVTREHCRLWWLADFIPFFGLWASPGDMLLFSCAAIFLGLATFRLIKIFVFLRRLRRARTP